MLNLIDGYSNGTLSAVALGNGKRPFAALNGRVGVIQLVDKFEGDMPQNFSKGNYLPFAYQEVLQADRGVWTLRGKKGQGAEWNCALTFLHTSVKDEYGKFPMIVFQGITVEKSGHETGLVIPRYQNEDYDVLLEEALTGSTGILVPLVKAFAFASVNPVRLKGGTVYSRPLELVHEAKRGVESH